MACIFMIKRIIMGDSLTDYRELNHEYTDGSDFEDDLLEEQEDS